MTLSIKPPEPLETRSDILEIARACARLSGIDLAVGIPAAAAQATAVEGAVSALYEGQNRYADFRGVGPLRQAIARRLRTEHGLDYDPEQELLVTSGVTGGFAACMLSLFARGDEVIIFEPFFGWHDRLMRLAGLTPRFVALEGADHRVDLDALRAAVGPRTRGLVLCTPNNPCGKVWTDEELGHIEALALDHGLLVISDEQYEAFCFDGRAHRSPACLPALREQTIVLGGFSKSLSVTGWRMAFAAAPAQLISAVGLMHQTLYICAATPLQHGVARSLAGLDLSAERARLQDNRDLLCAALADAGFELRPPEGGFFVMADATPLTSLSSMQLAMTLLERAGVAAVPGRAFHHDAADSRHLRFCFARPRAVLEEACRRLRALAPGALSPQQAPRSLGTAQIRPITTQADVDAAAGLAYELYVEEMGILGERADHEQRRLYADDVEGATVLGAFVGGELVGCITLMLYADAPFSDFYERVFDLPRFDEVAPRDQATIITRLLITPAHQRGALATRLMGMALLSALARGVRMIYADSQPHLVPLYERIGMRPYGQPFNYGDSGIGIVLVAGLFEHERFRRIQSPLLPLLPKDIEDPEAAARLDRALGEVRPVYSKRSTPKVYADLLETSVASILASPTQTAIFRGFSAEELLSILDRGYALDCSAGIKLISRGQKTRTVYVVLSGELEVELKDRRRKQGPGDILGEIAYLTGGARTADVWVTADHTRVLCLSEKTMRTLSEGEPALAARFLGNLSRVLARRVVSDSVE